MTPHPDDNVVIRLKQKLREARQMGFKVRMEMLDGEQATWCEIAGVQTLFVDISQTAGEQLQQVDQTLRTYLSSRSVPGGNLERQNMSVAREAVKRAA